MDRIKLKEKIYEKGLKYSHIAKKLGLSAYGFSLKINGKSDFKWEEILKMCDLLNVDDEEKKEIFF